MLKPKRVLVVYGTRPEAVKLLGVVDALGPQARTLHSGQHYSPELASEFEGALGLRAPDRQLDVGGTTRGEQIGGATIGIEAELRREAVDALIVQGDTNTALAGALAANAAGVALVHVEAGLRSFDRAMPEEHNRVVVDHLSDLCAAPTETSRANLAAEGIAGDDRVVVTGNTVVEAVQRLAPPAAETASILAARSLTADSFVLATFHRPENVDDPEVLATILRELAALPLPVVLPLHPRTEQRARAAGLGDLLAQVRIEPPAGYRCFLGLMARSAFAVSDSGGVQEESSVVKRPVIVVRRSTERPEVLGTFCELVPAGARIGEVARQWLDDLPGLHAKLATIDTPYGDGLASQRIVDAVERMIG
ncbi:MAG: UDP-N-acetylglucosamine 2-epimerase [Actinomycetia bacterium]|nr:UDP-N-acetylglucosamine 2-epimerase [Actinomycetes bacterium]